MTRVRLRRSDTILHLVGPAPKLAGDRFQASADPLPTAKRESGCMVVPLTDGAAFVCNRGGSARRASPVRDYKFNPELHELLP